MTTPRPEQEHNDEAPASPYPQPSDDYGKPKRRLSRIAKTKTGGLMTGEAVSAVYPNALELPGLVSSAKGLGVLVGIFSLGVALFSAYMTLLIAADSEDAFAFGLLTFSTFLAAVCAGVTSLRIGLFSYRDEPILFNRKTRKIHVFARKVRMSRPWLRWPLSIRTYDWECVVGEIYGGFRLLGGSLPTTRYRLVLTVHDAPTGHGKKPNVIDRIIVGAEEQGMDSCACRWEFIRSYMEENGPPLRPYDEIYNARKFSIQNMLLNSGFWICAPGFYRDFSKAPVGPLLGTLAQFVVLPVTIPLAIFQSLAEITGRNPWWPPLILDEAGGPPLPESEVLAQRDALARAQEADEYNRLAPEQREAQAFLKAEQEKPLISPEKRKILWAVAAIVFLAGALKIALLWKQGHWYW